MNNGESITSYFLRIFALKDQLATIGNQVDEKELSMISLKGLPMSWKNFILGLSSQLELPKFESLKNESTQEESRLISRGISLNQEGDIQALQISTNNKRSFKRNKIGSNKPYKKRDWSKM